MENKENTPTKDAIKPPVSSQYARRVLQEINAPQAFEEIPRAKPDVPRTRPRANQDVPKIDQCTQTSSTLSLASEQPGTSRGGPLFSDIQPEAFSPERRNLRTLAGRIYLVYCHLCCMDKKFKISESDLSWDSEDRVEEIVVESDSKDQFLFGKTVDTEIEKVVENTARFAFGSSTIENKPNTSFPDL